ncbi:hypothetical protein BDR06DRAFT_946210 [Suillus hirtellus]|nr:hypothetical protein BDR06DRAFT_946210 [Suillus hirtellus]
MHMTHTQLTSEPIVPRQPLVVDVMKGEYLKVWSWLCFNVLSYAIFLSDGVAPWAGINGRAGKGMTTSYHVEIREDIIYNQLPLEGHYIYQTLEQGTTSLISERLDGYWRDLETGCLDQPLRFLRSIQSVLHGHAQKACRHNSFLPKK